MLVITRRQLLGDGSSPFDKRWGHRLRERCDPWPWHEGRVMACIEDGFENRPGVKWDSILDAGEAWRLVQSAQGLH